MKIKKGICKSCHCCPLGEITTSSKCDISKANSKPKNNKTECPYYIEDIPVISNGKYFTITRQRLRKNSSNRNNSKKKG